MKLLRFKILRKVVDGESPRNEYGDDLRRNRGFQVDPKCFEGWSCLVRPKKVTRSRVFPTRAQFSARSNKLSSTTMAATEPETEEVCDLFKVLSVLSIIN